MSRAYWVWMDLKMKMTVCAVTCLAAGFLIGRWLPATNDNSILPQEITAAGSAVEPNTRTRMPVQPAPAVSGKAEQGKETKTAEQAEGMVWIPASLLGELSAAGGKRAAGQGIFGADDKIDEILGISDSEKAMIQTAWKQTQEKLRELETVSMKSEVSDDGSVVTITVPDLSARTAEVGDGFGSEIREALGENRSEVFLAVKQVDRMLSPEPGARTYRIEPEETGDGGWRYHITLEGPGSRRVWVSDTIPEEISHLTDVASIRRSLAEEIRRTPEK